MDKAEQGTETPDAAAQVATLTAQVGTLTTERDALSTQVTTLTSERNTLAQQVVTLTGERDAALAQAEAFGEQPGEKPTQVGKKADETPKAEGDTLTWQQVIAELPSEKEAAAAGY